jgi:anthranilate synthase/aminodeoxychorismate synthase-like glutamine amidotransferase
LRALFIDHYDSFSFNLIAWLGELGLEVTRITHDDAGISKLLKNHPEQWSKRYGLVVFSPGPYFPEHYSQSIRLLNFLKGNIPIFGICLGHQMIASVMGLDIVKSQQPLHGLCRRVRLNSHSQFRLGGVKYIEVAAYNSLAVRADMSDEFWAMSGENTVEGILTSRYGAPMISTQFHPESFLSERLDFLRNKLQEIIFS